MSPSIERAVVVGGGIAGLGAAWALLRAGVEVQLVEAGARLGGLVETEQTPDGLLIEHGPDALLEARPGARELLDALGLRDELVRDGPAPRRAYVAVDAHRLVPLPEGLAGLVPRDPLSVFRSPLLDVRAKLRLLMEPFVGGRRESGPTSVGAFVERRMGRQARARLVDPLLRGIYGVGGDQLDLDATMPHLRAMVREHGCLGLAVLDAARKPPSPGLCALRGGMASLTHGLAEEIGAERITFEAPVAAIERAARGMRVRTARGTVEADAVIVAAPARHAETMLARLAPALGEALASLPHVGADVVTLAYDRDDVGHPLDGTGYVVAAPDARTRACTWASGKWHGRAPEDTALLRTVVDAPDASDAEVVALAREELERLLAVRGEPKLVRLRRHRAALPVPSVGHPARRQRLNELARELGPLRLVGGASGALGVPECLRTALAAVDELTGTAAA